MCVELLQGEFSPALTYLEGRLGVLSTSMPTLLERPDQSSQMNPLVLVLVNMFHWSSRPLAIYRAESVCR